MRILWLSNSPNSPSGYGEQTALFLPRLRDAGHELAVLCNYGLHGRPAPWEGFLCYPSDGLWGNVALPAIADLHEADLVIALCDAWVLHPDKWPQQLRSGRPFPPVAIWAPVDHYPIPPPVYATLNSERVQPVAMSRFGEEMMRSTTIDPLYVPHAVDTSLFCPRPEQRAQVRAELEIPEDVFLVGMVAANQSGPVSRKAFHQAFHAFMLFAKSYSDAWMYVHTQARPPAGPGLKLDILAEATSVPKERLRFPHDELWMTGLPASSVAALYQAFDVLLSPSMGEGFGIPLLEAQACGVPVIASDHSAMSEIAEAGWLVRGDPFWDETQSSFLISPSIDAIVIALEHAYAARDDQELRRYAVEFARQYDVERVTEQHWLPALEQIEADIALRAVA